MRVSVTLKLMGEGKEFTLAEVLCELSSSFQVSNSFRSVFDDFQSAVSSALDSDLNVEGLHRLRINARKLEAALNLSQSCFEGNGSRRLYRLIQKLREVSNPVRDLDVMIEWSAQNDGGRSAKPLKQLQQKRLQKGEALVSMLHTKFSSRRMAKFEERLRFKPLEHSLSRVGLRLLASLGRFCEMGERFLDDARYVHRWRVPVKKLRYELEFVADMDPIRFERIPHEALVQLQQKLGKICDAENRNRTLASDETLPKPEIDSNWYEERIGQVIHGVMKTVAVMSTEGQC